MVQLLACGSRCYGKNASPKGVGDCGARQFTLIVGALSTSVISLRRLSDTTGDHKGHCLLGRVTRTAKLGCAPICNGTTDCSKNDVKYNALMGGSLAVAGIGGVPLPNSRPEMIIEASFRSFIFVDARFSLGSGGHVRKTKVVDARLSCVHGPIFLTNSLGSSRH